MELLSRRAVVLAGHFRTNHGNTNGAFASIDCAPCLEYNSPSGSPAIDISIMRQLLDGHDLEARDAIVSLMVKRPDLFQYRKAGSRIFMAPDLNQTMEAQREMTMKRIHYFLQVGLSRGWLTDDCPEAILRMAAMFEYMALFDHSLAIKFGVQFHLWGNAIRFLGTKKHRDKWLQITEDYAIKGCLAMTELGHGSNVRGIETITTYDPSTQEFIINTPCESAQKYWIGGAAELATHAVVFSQLHINGRNEGVHAFIAEIRDEHGQACPDVRIADCGHKIGLNGVDNGRIWFDYKRVPLENLLNSVADVTADGQYVSSIPDLDKRFGAFMAPLTFGRVSIAVQALYELGLATTIRYGLARRAFSQSPNEQEVLLLDYPSHQHRLLPLLAKTYAMSFAAWDLKRMYVNRTTGNARMIHMLSSGYKAMFSWHNMRTLQECREACGGQGLKTENRVGQLKAEFDVQLTFEGDNNVLMQQVSKMLLADYFASTKKGHEIHKSGSLHKFHIRDPTSQINIFQLRERDLLEKLAQQVRALVSSGSTMTSALLTSHRLAEDLGRAFSERCVLDSFLDVENSVTGPLKEILGLLRSLFVASLIDENPVFLKYGYLTPQQAMLVQTDISCLCKEIRPHALSLVDAFGIPEAFLGPIAFNWIAANAWELEQQA